MVKRIDIRGDGSWNELPTGAWVSSREYDKLEAALRKIANQEPAAMANWCAEVARAALAEPETNSRNQAGTAPSDAGATAPTPRGSLPNSLGVTPNREVKP